MRFETRAKKPLRHDPTPSLAPRPTQLVQKENCWAGRFQAMACDCEILVDTDEQVLAKKMLRLAAGEAWRIERKFSRYRKGNIIDRINHGKGAAVVVDEECAQLLNFAHQCHEISEGMFDITSGVLRRIWKFDGSNRIPTQRQVEKILPLIGWEKVSWMPPVIRVPESMEIDLGGIGKEYAVDCIFRLLREKFAPAVLVNLGGDTVAGGKRRDGQPWNIGIENDDPRRSAVKVIQVRQGAVATSGDSKRFLLKDGKRYGHILNPRTGWPAENAPHSMTVAANTCTEAGFLSTLAMLHGEEAESVLEAEGVRYWCSRGRNDLAEE